MKGGDWYSDGVRHAARVARLDAVDVNRELANRVAGDQQIERRARSSRLPNCDELLRLQTDAIPGVAGIGFDALLVERLVKRDGRPARVVEVGIGPAGIVANLETPGPVEVDDAPNASR